ncbi:fibronectin type III domain-containing protein [Streptomyces sp. NPDC001480]|uniref:fibronectin type III domain-containing protein n=1 Tax=Streptomyces sp. NPDC001480 TaxID=3364577 RepID=UPI00369E5B83
MTSTNNVHVHGDVDGQVVVGSRNVVQTVVVNAAQGSSVMVRPEGPPQVERRGRPVGRALPRRIPALLGREHELARLDDWLAEGHPVQIYGPPGVGKSALLRRVAADRAARPGGGDVIYLPAIGLPVEDVVQDLFHACFETEDYKPDRARVRRLMGAVRALLVVDDFQGGPEDLATLVDAAPGCEVVVACGEHIAWDEARALRLNGLAEEHALALLARELGRPLRGGELDAARGLITTIQGHPLTLVQAASAIAAAERSTAATTADPGGEPESGAVPAGTGFDVHESALAVGLAGRLSDEAGKLLRLLRAFEPFSLSPALLTVLAGGMDRAAVTELESLALVACDSTGYRVVGRFAALVAERAGTVRGAAELARPLVDWIQTTTARRDVADEAAAICHVLAAAARAGDHAAVRDLARATAPVFARTLRWGAWRQVLEFGLEAARALGSAEDMAYFSREEQVRRRGLGLAAGMTAGVTAGAAAVLSQGALHGATAKSGVASSGAAKSGVAAIASSPTAIGVGVAALVAGGIFTAGLVGGGGEQPAAAPAASSQVTAFTPPPSASSLGPRPYPSRSRKPTNQSSGPSLTEQDTEPPSSKPDDSHSTCTAVSMGPETFGPVAAGKEETRHMEFAALSGCGDKNTLAVDDETNWKVEPTSCPPPDQSGACKFDVVFTPQDPGQTYTARVTMLDDSRRESMTLQVTGTSAEGPPGAPTDVGSFPVSTTSIFISWGYVPGNPTDIEINNGETSQTVPGGRNAYTWEGLAPGTHMCFRVRAVNSAGVSDWAPLESPYYTCATTPTNGG